MSTFPSSRRRSIFRSRSAAHDVHADDHADVFELVEAAKSGDRAAFGDLYDRYHGIVYRLMRGRVSSIEDAEDLVAETFLQTWRAIGSFQWTGAPFAAWLLRIAATCAVSHHRSATRRPQRAGSDDDVMREACPGQGTAERTEQRMHAQHLLQLLSEEHRTVLALRFYGGLSAEEIGALVGKRAATVRQMQMIALERLASHTRREQAA